jgi:multidrug resistance efflux pump
VQLNLSMAVPPLALALACVITLGCSRPPVNASAGAITPTQPPQSLESAQPASGLIVRATGIVQAVRSYTVRVPQLAQQVTGRTPQVTLTALVPNGTSVMKGHILAEFDQTAQIDDARDAKAKLNEFEHQLAEKRALVHSDSVTRVAEIREAEVELGKAELQLQRGPVLAELERKKNEIKAASARERLAGLRKSHEYRINAEAATIRVLELKCERQKVVTERLDTNIASLTVKAPHDGMVALENVWRSGSMGPPQVGDQLWPNQPVLRVFDPAEMIVETQVNEPDVAVLAAMSRAKVHVDAYPSAVFDAHLESVSPVATAGLESPVKSFSARFRIAQVDPRLLPDLSVAMEIEIPAKRPSDGAQASAGSTGGRAPVEGPL